LTAFFGKIMHCSIVTSIVWESLVLSFTFLPLFTHSHVVLLRVQVA